MTFRCLGINFEELGQLRNNAIHSIFHKSLLELDLYISSVPTIIIYTECDGMYVIYIVR